MALKDCYTVNEHYTPESFLELFRDSDGRFYYLNKQYNKISYCDTAKACYEENLYETIATIDGEEIYILRNDIEDTLSRNEKKYIELVKKIISICSDPINAHALILHTDEKRLLMEFIANLHLRHPNRLYKYMEDLPISEEGLLFEKEIQDTKEENPSAADFLNSIWKTFQIVRMKATVLNESKNSWMSFLIDEMMKGRYCFLYSPKGEFIISDDIASISKDECLYLALNCYFAVCVCLNKNMMKREFNNRICRLDGDIVENIDKVVYQGADKYVYGKRDTLLRLSYRLKSEN